MTPEISAFSPSPRSTPGRPQADSQDRPVQTETVSERLTAMLAGLQSACSSGCSCGACMPADPRQALAAFKARDAEVQEHEHAHQRVAGPDACGTIVYQYLMGPDGQMYRVGGHVNVSLRDDDADPEDTLARMKRIEAAALAPADPSGQDLKVAAEAAMKAQKARFKMDARHHGDATHSKQESAGHS